MPDWNAFWRKRDTKEKAFNLGGIIFNRAFARHIARKIGPPPSCGPVLEIGAGRGVCSLMLKGMGYDCTSVDNSEVAVELAKKNKLEVLLCDARQLPFGRKEFGVAFTQGLLEHIPFDDQVAILEETRRVANIVIHSVPARYGLMDLGERVFRLTGREWPYPDEKKYGKSEFRELLGAAFQTVKVERFMGVDWIGYCGSV
jgi:hypothetical protein